MRILGLLLLKCLFLCVALNADEIFIPSPKLHLQKSYTVSDEDIYSTDMFPNIDRKFKVLTLPPESFRLKVKSVAIKLLFARYGYDIVSFESEYVEFNFVTDMREKDIFDFIEKMYIKHYGENLHIKDVRVKPWGKIPEGYELLGFDISESALKKNSGTLSMKYRTANNPKVKKLTFLYMIDATLKVLKSTQNIAVNETIDKHNTSTDTIVFEKVGAEYIGTKELNTTSAKIYIRANTAITKDKIKPKIIVRKGERIRVVGYDDGISMEIILEARQNGAFNDIINAQNPSSKKILRVRVVDEGRGEIL